MTYIDYQDVVFYNLYIGRGADSNIVMWVFNLCSVNFEAVVAPLEQLHAHSLPEDT